MSSEVRVGVAKPQRSVRLGDFDETIARVVSLHLVGMSSPDAGRVVCHIRGTGRNSRLRDGFLQTRHMTALMKKMTIPLDHAVLCLDCDCVSDANRECPACSSRALMNLSVVLNRPAEFAEYEKLANAA